MRGGNPAGAPGMGVVRPVSLADPNLKQPIVQTDSNGGFGTGPDGRHYLFYHRDFTLVAHPFDAGRGELIRDSVIVARAIEPAQTVRFAPFAVSGRALVYRPRFRPDTRLVWRDRKGLVQERVGVDAQRYSHPSLSPDGSKLAVTHLDRRTNTENIWWFDLRRHVRERLTLDPWEHTCRCGRLMGPA